MGNPWQYDFSAIGTAAPLLIVHGTDADPAAKKQGGGFLATGNADIYKLIPETMPFEQVNLSKTFRRRQGKPDVTRFERVLNLVTDADQHPDTLASVGKLLRGYRGRILNRPEAILRTSRDQVANRLQGIEGLKVPKAIRLRNPKPGAASEAARRAGLEYPLIARQAGTHTGKIIGLFPGPGELDAAVSEPGTVILTEFVDFSSGDGLFRKYRVFCIGGRRLFRHLIIADSWSIHAQQRFDFMAKHPHLIAEEQRIMKDPAGVFPASVSSALDEVAERLGLDFFGIDFGILDDGRAVLFEANATMNFFPVVDFPPFEHIQAVIDPAREALLRLLGLAEQRPLASVS
jgi:glutathione synthase/RimK-type ligase-like ATP-grasp enzyme